MTKEFGPTIPLAPIAARELGRVLEGWRSGNRLTLADVERAGGPVDAYASQIEQGSKTNVSESMFRRQAKAIRLPDEMLDDLFLRARAKSALEWHGIPQPDIDVAWDALVKHLASHGHRVETDFATALARLMLDPDRPQKRRRQHGEDPE